MDKITIQDLEVEAHIGVTDAERSQPQRLLITVVLERDLAEAARRDAEEATTRYDEVAEMIRAIARERPRRLVEAVAGEIARAILDRRMASATTVEVKKFSVPKSRHVSVQIHRAL
jgi:dihydroneopterin aldolase